MSVIKEKKTPTKRVAKKKTETIIKMTDLTKRNPDTGLIEGLEYHYDEYGYIDWEKMVPDKFFYPKDDEDKGKPTKDLPNYKKCILLGGIRYLARIRGYKSVNNKIVSADSIHAAATCSISWIANKETGSHEEGFSDNACAHSNNTDGLSQYYLTEIASNRAFVRSVRNYLGINIVGKDELSKRVQTGISKKQSTEAPSTHNPQQHLENVCNSKGWSFNQIKTRLIEKGINAAQTYMIWGDIPENICFEIISKIAI